WLAPHLDCVRFIVGKTGEEVKVGRGVDLVGALRAGPDAQQDLEAQPVRLLDEAPRTPGVLARLPGEVELHPGHAGLSHHVRVPDVMLDLPAELEGAKGRAPGARG